MEKIHGTIKSVRWVYWCWHSYYKGSSPSYQVVYNSVLLKLKVCLVFGMVPFIIFPFLLLFIFFILIFFLTQCRNKINLGAYKGGHNPSVPGVQDMPKNQKWKIKTPKWPNIFSKYQQKSKTEKLASTKRPLNHLRLKSYCWKFTPIFFFPNYVSHNRSFYANHILLTYICKLYFFII